MPEAVIIAVSPRQIVTESAVNPVTGIVETDELRVIVSLMEVQTHETVSPLTGLLTTIDCVESPLFHAYDVYPPGAVIITESPKHC